MKILYDDSKKRQIDTSLEELKTSLDKALRYAEGTSIPYAFGRRSDITSTCITTLRNSKNLVGQIQHWYQKTNSAFNDKNNSIKVRVAKIQLLKIKKKDLLVR